MGLVTLDVGGRRYDVNCRDGEEPRLRALARIVDDRARQAAEAVGRGGESRELLLTALLLADALDEACATRDAIQAVSEARTAGLERLADRLEHVADGLEMAGATA